MYKWSDETMRCELAGETQQEKSKSQCEWRKNENKMDMYVVYVAHVYYPFFIST